MPDKELNKNLPKTNNKDLSNVFTSFKKVARELYKKNLQLNVEHQRLEDILLQVAEAIFAVDADYNITLFNASAETMFGVRKEGVIGKNPDTFMTLLFDDTNQKKVSIKDYAFVKETPQLKDKLERIVLNTKDGNIMYLKLNYKNIVYEKGSKECVISLADITQEVAIDKQKDEFISVASHELKTPISIVNTNLWMFKHISKGQIDKKQNHFIEEMEYGLSRLSKIVNNLLDISRIEQGRFVLDEKEVDLDLLIKESMDYFEDLTAKKGLKLIKPHKKVGKWVVDKDRFREALDNFISNAIKYTDKGGVKVNLDSDNKSVTVMVTDSGPGISVADQKRLFKKFSRAKEGLKQETAGASTGLGLYITKRIIEEMGGKVGVKSKAGKGSTFWFSIPRRAKVSGKDGGGAITKEKIEAIKQEVKAKK